MRLFLFPYAGGGPAVFGKWPAGFPETIETWLVHYPGRGARHSEQPLKRVISLAENLSQAIEPLLDKPFAFFGHSLGALVAFELARQLHQQNLPRPKILFVSACGAPDGPDPNPPIHTLPDSQFLRALQDLNGIPGEVMNVPELLEILLPTLRADLEAAETYTPAPGGTKLNCPILALSGMDDQRISAERIEGWSSHTTAAFQSRYFPGDQFIPASVFA